MRDAAVEKNPWGLDDVPGRFKTKEMCDKVEDHSPYMLHDIPDCFKTLSALRQFAEDHAIVFHHLKTKEMCNETVEEGPGLYTFVFITNHFKIQEMYTKAVQEGPLELCYVPDQYKTEEMCDKTVRDDPSSLEYVPDWLVTQREVKIWHDDDYYCDDDRLVEWYEGYQKRKAKKAQIKQELFPIA